MVTPRSNSRWKASWRRTSPAAAVAHVLGIERWSDATAAALASSALDSERLLTLALVSPEHLTA